MARPTGVNLVNCSASGVLGTGLAGCKTDRKRVVALGLLEKGYIFSGDITKSSMQTLQQQGKLIYLKGVITFADNTPDPTIVTREGSGLKTIVGKLPYEYVATFDNGYNFQKALNALDGNGNYDLVLFDVDDRMWFTENKAGDVKGFSLGMHNNGNYKGNDGTNAASETLSLQLTDRAEVDERMAQFLPTDFGASDLDGVNEVTITINPVVAAATTLVFAPKLQDMSHLVEGLVIANFKFTKNGSAITPTGLSYTTNPGYITVTVPSVTAADIYTIITNDAALVTNIIKTTLGTLYKADVATVTATA